MSRKVWFISDTHINHSNIIDYCLRPFDNVQEMNEVIINNWNNAINPNDQVYHLGDVCMGRRKDAEKAIRRLQGNIRLIRGNHDGRFDDLYQEVFDKVSRDYFINIDVNGETERIYMVHRPRDRKFNYFTICGHTHDYWRFLPNRLNVSVEQWAYHPVSLGDVKHYIEVNRHHKQRAKEKGYIWDKEKKVDYKF